MPIATAGAYSFRAGNRQAQLPVACRPIIMMSSALVSKCGPRSVGETSMGIKFHCPNGHKLNVKSFLAGKKGVCPECGVKIVIPETSEPKRKRKQGVGRDGQPLADTTTLPNESMATAAPATIAVAPMAAVMNTMPGAAAPVSAVSPVAIPGMLPTMKSPTPGSFPSPAPVPTGFPSPVPVPGSFPGIPNAAPMPSPMPMMTAPQGLAMPASPMAGAAAAPFQTIVPQAIAPQVPFAGAAAAPAAATVADPITENPNATWYVRPPSGGQYGPARGDVMRKWIGEGRVSADSLVWREGWTDWLAANVIFPSLKGAPAPTETPAAAPFLNTAPTTSTSTARKRTRSKSPSPTTAVAIVVMLALLAVGLLIALFFVLNQSKRSSQKRTPNHHAAAGCVEHRRIL